MGSSDAPKLPEAQHPQVYDISDDAILVITQIFLLDYLTWNYYPILSNIRAQDLNTFGGLTSRDQLLKMSKLFFSPRRRFGSPPYEAPPEGWTIHSLRELDCSRVRSSNDNHICR
jgi:hypothetical protein